MRALVLTGSGISADSGIPTFRGAEGHWRRIDPRQLATPEAFARDPEVVWQWYCERRRQVAAASPNAAHEALARWAGACRDFLLVTQNVDDLHERAGSAKEKLVHVHGELLADRCCRCSFRSEALPPYDPPGACPACGARLRPGVVWFGESLDGGDVERVEGFLRQGPCDLVLVVGTTAVFDYVVDWAVRAAAGGGRLIEVNPEETRLSALAHDVIRERAAEALPGLLLD